MTLNDKHYWDGCFATEWEPSLGPVQTRAFCELAVATMPAWLVVQIKADRLGLCDWGNALGNGTQVLAQALGVEVVGVDFSPTAIDKARQRFPGLHLRVEDWIAGPPGAHHDVVISSNTLEHFAQPWQVFSRLADHARRHVVLLLPYQERERLAEHESTFDRNTIPMCPKPGWVLTDARITDLGPSPIWAGKQALLVYSQADALAAGGLSDCRSAMPRLPGSRPAADAGQQQLTCRDHGTATQVAMRR